MHLLIINSFFIFGLNYALQPGAIAGFIATWYDRHTITKPFFQWLRSPLFGCVVCMASIWGGTFYFLFSPTYSIQSVCVYIVALSGLNRLLKNFI